MSRGKPTCSPMFSSRNGGPHLAGTPNPVPKNTQGTPSFLVPTMEGFEKKERDHSHRICMYRRKMLTKLGFLLMVNVTINMAYIHGSVMGIVIH